MCEDIVVKDTIKNLTKVLNKARYYYYELNDPIMSDYEYDLGFDKLKKLEDKYGFRLINSPTVTVGYEVKNKLDKVIHKTKLLSLDKTKSVDDLNDFKSKRNTLFFYKLDGLTTKLVYENGVLVQASTRGSGEIGEDITHNAKTFVNLPQNINYKNRLELVGESIIDYETFEKIKKEENVDYKTPRNLVSGSVRQLDNKICARRNVKFYVFNVINGFNEFDSKHETFMKIENLGFDICRYWCEIPISNEIQEVIDYVSNNEKLIPIDGMVMTYDSKSYSESLGVTGHHPKHSIAFKWKDDTVETILRDIETDIGKNGQVSYTGIFDTVEIDGTDVSRATLHNLEYIRHLNLGIGDRIEVIKANMIIPQIVSNIDKDNNNDKYKGIKFCPYCNGEIVKNGVHQFCINDSCVKQNLEKINHFVSRNAMNIDGMSKQTINSIMNIRGNSIILESIKDIYGLKYYKSQLLTLDKFGEKKVDNLLNSVEKSKNTNLSRFIYSLSIPMVGKTASKDLEKYFKNDIDNIINSNYNIIELKNNIGDVVGSNFINFINDEQNKELLKYFKNILTFNNQDSTINKEDISNKIKDLVFVVTGKVNKFKNRKELELTIESNGGKISSKVNSKTNYLINNDVDSNSSKNKSAKELGVKIINEEEFLNMIG